MRGEGAGERATQRNLQLENGCYTFLRTTEIQFSQVYIFRCIALFIQAIRKRVSVYASTWHKINRRVTFTHRFIFCLQKVVFPRPVFIVKRSLLYKDLAQCMSAHGDISAFAALSWHTLNFVSSSFVRSRTLPVVRVARRTFLCV